MIERYELVQDSCGSGKYRGGMGIRRDIRPVGHIAELSTHADRQKFHPWGLAGGLDGASGKLIVNFGSAEARILPSGKTSDVILQPGDVLTVITPGGGVYGEPDQRSASAIANDLKNEVIPMSKARADFGLMDA
jgi:N-methylhydantoinase B